MTKAIRLLAVRGAMAGLLCVAATNTARADEQGSDGYRIEMAAASAGSLGLFLVGDALERQGRSIPDVMMAVGAISYPLVGPVIHLRHQRYGRALGSLAKRRGLPILGGAIGAGTANCPPDGFLCGLSEMGMGMVVGGVVASAVDTALLSGPATPRTADEDAAPRPARPTPPAATFAPTVAATSNLAYVGVSGRF
jgi:hypothetical protein